MDSWQRCSLEYLSQKTLGHPKDTLDAFKSAGTNLNMGFIIEPGIGINGTAFNKHAFNRIDWRKTVLFPNVVKQAYHGAIEVASQQAPIVLRQLPVSFFENIIQALIRIPHLLDASRGGQI